MGELGFAYTLAGKPNEAKRMLEEVQRLPENRAQRAYALSAIYTGLGNKDEAFQWLERSAANRDGWLIFLKVEPCWDSLRDDPRYRDLLKKMNLPP
jgi:hypothetical protein